MFRTILIKNRMHPPTIGGCFLTAVMLTALVSPQGARAQIATADIVGTVSDTSGGALPGAKIAANNSNTGLAYNAESNGDGDFLLTQLPAGHYRLRAAPVHSLEFDTFATETLGEER